SSEISSWPQAASLSWNEPLVTRSPKRWPGSKRLPWGSTRPSIMSSGGSYGGVILLVPFLDRQPWGATVDRFSAGSPSRCGSAGPDVSPPAGGQGGSRGPQAPAHHSLGQRRGGGRSYRVDQHGHQDGP